MRMTSLEKSTRRKIFYTFALLFLLVVPLALLYSTGYVVDLKTRGFVATGGIFVKTVHPGARVFVDSEFQKETSFISRGALITNLLPKRYALRVEKEGFQPWQKVVRVANEEVLEFRNIFLPPATITPSVAFRAGRELPTRLMVLPGRRELGLEVGNPARPFSVFVVNPDTRLARINLIQVSQWSWDATAETFIIARRSNGQTKWYRLPFSAAGSAREEPIVFRGLPKDFSAAALTPHPSNPQEFYFFAGGGLFLQGRSSVPVPIAEEIHSYAVAPERLYFLSKNGFFAESNLDGRDAKILGRKGLFLDEENPARILLSPAGDVLVLDSAGGLFLYQPTRDQELELVAGNVVGIDFSASGDRMLYWDENRLWIYWLKDNPDQPFDLARTRKQIFYSEERIRQAFLSAEGTHLFFSAGNRIRMTEADSRANTNAYDVARSPHEAFALDKKELTLYWVEGSMLLRAALR